MLGKDITIRFYDASQPAQAQPAGVLTVCSVPLMVPVSAGKLDKRNGKYVLATLRRAAEGCLSGEFAALVTGPVHKGVINEAGVPFSGHTEFFAEQAGVDVEFKLYTGMWHNFQMFSPWFDEAKTSLADIATFAHRLDQD